MVPSPDTASCKSERWPDPSLTSLIVLMATQVATNVSHRRIGNGDSITTITTKMSSMAGAIAVSPLDESMGCKGLMIGKAI